MKGFNVAYSETKQDESSLRTALASEDKDVVRTALKTSLFNQNEKIRALAFDRLKADFPLGGIVTDDPKTLSAADVGNRMREIDTGRDKSPLMAKDKYGNSLIHMIAIYGREDLLMLFVHFGFGLDAPGMFGL